MMFKILRKKNKKKESYLQEEWNETTQEGELAIDAFETDKEIVIQSPIGGISAKDINIAAEDGMLIIKGKRSKPRLASQNVKYFYQECFWGPFSKRIILPEEIDIKKAKASIKNGVLTLKIPKLKPKIRAQIEVVEEE
ncbi:Hsp20/alpha crystallin family protein [bacterium]|nr:Hsp20/alpha crystallin family protein [bacterium]